MVGARSAEAVAEVAGARSAEAVAEVAGARSAEAMAEVVGAIPSGRGEGRVAQNV